MQSLSCDAKIINIRQDTESEKTIITLDQTIFYPQGGGQPYDTGIITSENGVFHVEKVYYKDGLVEHVGHNISGNCTLHENITCTVDRDRRVLNTRLHSAGHLIDLALTRLNLKWKPGKGFHVLPGAYVEYTGSYKPEDKEVLMQNLEKTCNDIIQENIETSCTFETGKTFNGKPLRTVHYGEFRSHCGGTHVENLNEIGSITIRKIKLKKGIIRISYGIQEII